MATSYTFRFPGSCAGLDVAVYDSEDTEVDTDTLGDAEGNDWGPVLHTVELPFDTNGYYAVATNDDDEIVNTTPGTFELEALVSDLDGAVGGFSQAAFVDDADDSDASSVAAAVDALRDALIDAGLMEAAPPPPPE